MNGIDVTDKVSFGEVDDEISYITKCICGKTFQRWDFTILLLDQNSQSCPNCNRKFYFSNKVTIYEVANE